MAEKRNEYVSRALLVATIGLESAAKLTDAFGGRRYRVPRRIESERFIELARIVGYSAARMMAETWGGEGILLPTRAAAVSHKLGKKIYARYRRGETPQQIAIALKVNLHYLYRLLNEAKKTADP